MGTEWVPKIYYKEPFKELRLELGGICDPAQRGKPVFHERARVDCHLPMIDGNELEVTIRDVESRQFQEHIFSGSASTAEEIHEGVLHRDQ